MSAVRWRAGQEPLHCLMQHRPQPQPRCHQVIAVIQEAHFRFQARAQPAGVHPCPRTPEYQAPHQLTRSCHPRCCCQSIPDDHQDPDSCPEPQPIHHFHRPSSHPERHHPQRQ
ncbi:MAG TPA: hypothetical protein DEO58_03395 [Alphaproteobacteria bacterium]|nr:hypothetical protein [Alphaproteobacteria bacterium]